MKGCEHCDAGWVQVKPAYAVHQFPDPTDEQLAGLDPAEVEQLHAHIAERRRAAAKSAYPCRECNRPMFFRWAGGHMKPNHDRLGCPECRELDGRKGRGRGGPRDLVRDGPAPASEPLPVLDRTDLF